MGVLIRAVVGQSQLLRPTHPHGARMFTAAKAKLHWLLIPSLIKTRVLSQFFPTIGRRPLTIVVKEYLVCSYKTLFIVSGCLRSGFQAYDAYEPSIHWKPSSYYHIRLLAFATPIAILEEWPCKAHATSGSSCAGPTANATQGFWGSVAMGKCCPGVRHDGSGTLSGLRDDSNAVWLPIPEKLSIAWQ